MSECVLAIHDASLCYKLEVALVNSNSKITEPIADVLDVSIHIVITTRIVPPTYWFQA